MSDRRSQLKVTGAAEEVNQIVVMPLNGRRPGVVGRATPWASWPTAVEVENACSLDEGIHPQLIVVFVIHPDELARKYGERAGRFALVEVGHAAQNLALRLARSRMIGYEIGGLQDRAV